MKRLWISIKRGFIREPKHRLAVGECVWLFAYMLDIADWETGIIHEWKDEAAAEDMEMPIRTLREQRRKLEELNYISTFKKQYTQDIAIHNWTNPRDYTGEILNKKQGGNGMEPQSYIQSDTQSSSQNVTPTFNPKNQKPLIGGLTEKEFEQANDKVTAIIKSAKTKSYVNRDKIPEPYLEYADLYNQLTGQEPTKRVLSGWLETFYEWQTEGIKAKHIREAYTQAEHKFPIVRPGSLTNTASAIAAKSKLIQEEAPVIFKAEEHPDPAFTKMPEELRQKMKALIKSKEIKND